MTSQFGGAVESRDASRTRLRRLFLAIVLTEALVISALYWFGRYFS